MIKVSVIVPTYRSGEGLLRVVQSLRNQTLPADEFEVIFIDDGSPDDTWERLQHVRAEHSNVSIQRIENSGWPSRPRNIGIESARGEYVLFMDHDDELYPDALRAGYEFAKRNNADVLNGKEARTDHPKWAIGAYPGNIDNVLDTDRALPLTPMNPHKLYRRAFLNEHEIRFPEGRRVLWEDIYFNVDAQRHARVISTLADTPFYHWVQTDENNSSTFATDPTEYWRNMRWLLEYVAENLDGKQRDQLLHSQYLNKVLTKVGPGFFDVDDDAREEVLEHAEAIIDELIPEEFDAKLPKTLRARAHLLRNREHEALRHLVEVDAGLTGLSHTADVEWRDGKLHIWSTARWHTRGDRQPSLVEHGGRILRDLPAVVEAELPAHMIDVTDEVMRASSTIGLRSRVERVTWMVPSTCEVVLNAQNGAAEVTVDAHATLDIDTAIFGKPLEDVVWEFNARNNLFGTVNQRGLRAQRDADVALIHGRVAIVYTSKHGMLTLDLGQNVRNVVNSSRPRLADAQIKPKWGSRFEVSIPLDGVAVTGETRIPGRLRVGDRWHSRVAVVGADGQARLEGVVRANRGTHPVTLTFGGRTVPATFLATVSTDGTLTFHEPSEAVTRP